MFFPSLRIPFLRRLLSASSYTLGVVSTRSIGKFPFACYAAQYWVDHTRFEDVSSSIQDAMEQLFDEEGPSFATWIWIYNVDYPFQPHMFKACPAKPEAMPLYYAALCGFHDLVKHLITIHPEAINFGGGNCRANPFSGSTHSNEFVAPGSAEERKRGGREREYVCVCRDDGVIVYDLAVGSVGNSEVRY
jgi:hypothetical protein